MKGYLRLPVYFAMAWFFIKLILFVAGMKDSLIPGIMVNMLLLLASVAVGLFFKKKAENYADVNFLDDMKIAIKSGMAYVGLVTLFIFSFYKWVDPNYIQGLRDQKEKQVTEYLSDDENLKNAKEQNQNLQDLSREDIIDLQVEQATAVYSPFFTATFSILSMMTGVFINSLLVVFLFRNVLFRDMRVVEEKK